MPDIKSTIDELNKKQSRQNWEKFGSALKKSQLAYYLIVYDKGKINKKEDLRDAYAELYGKDGKFAYKVPVVMEEKGKVRGATIYLKGLLNFNRK